MAGTPELWLVKATLQRASGVRRANAVPTSCRPSARSARVHQLLQVLPEAGSVVATARCDARFCASPRRRACLLGCARPWASYRFVNSAEPGRGRRGDPAATTQGQTGVAASTAVGRVPQAATRTGRSMASTRSRQGKRGSPNKSRGNSDNCESISQLLPLPRQSGLEKLTQPPPRRRRLFLTRWLPLWRATVSPFVLLSDNPSWAAAVAFQLKARPSCQGNRKLMHRR